MGLYLVGNVLISLVVLLREGGHRIHTSVASQNERASVKESNVYDLSIWLQFQRHTKLQSVLVISKDWHVEIRKSVFLSHLSACAATKITVYKESIGVESLDGFLQFAHGAAFLKENHCIQTCHNYLIRVISFILKHSYYQNKLEYSELRCNKRNN